MTEDEVENWMDQFVSCMYCQLPMQRRELYGHECEHLRAARERGRKFLERMEKENG